jgi:hypothetical protein
MPNAPTERCSICGSRHRWEIDNSLLAHGPAASRELAEERGITKSAWYRHRNSHMSLAVDTPPIDRSSIEWVRAVMNMAASVEAYRLIVDPTGIGDIAVLVGRDDLGQYIELAMIYTDGAVDGHQVQCMAHDLNLDIEDDEISPGIRPTRRMSAKLRTDEVFVGRRYEKR